MYETDAQLAAMQTLIDRSMESASDQLRSIARPDRRLSAGSDLVGITAHGTATLHEWGAPRFHDLDKEFLAVYGGTPSTQEEGVVFIEVTPTRLYTFDRRGEVGPKSA